MIITGFINRTFLAVIVSYFLEMFLIQSFVVSKRERERKKGRKNYKRGKGREENAFIQ